jgi:hypothetical protein
MGLDFFIGEGRCTQEWKYVFWTDEDDISKLFEYYYENSSEFTYFWKLLDFYDGSIFSLLEIKLLKKEINILLDDLWETLPNKELEYLNNILKICIESEKENSSFYTCWD